MASAVLGFGHLAFMVGGQTLIAVQSDRDRRDREYGLCTVLTSLGQLVGPAPAGLAMAGGVRPSVGATTRLLVGRWRERSVRQERPASARLR